MNVDGYGEKMICAEVSCDIPAVEKVCSHSAIYPWMFLLLLLLFFLLVVCHIIIHVMIENHEQLSTLTGCVKPNSV